MTCLESNLSANQLLLSNNNATAVPVAVTPASTTVNNIPVYSNNTGSVLGAGITPGIGVATFLETPSGANLASALTSALPNTTGGTGGDSSSSTGVAQLNAGTWSYNTALANGTTATTQSACDNSTKVATTAFVQDCANYQGAVNAIGAAGAAQTIACTGGGVQSMTLSANLTITLTQPSGTTCLIRMEITQAGGGGDTVTITGAKWPGGIAPVMTATASALDVWSCLLDGTNTFCTAGQNFQ